MIDLTEYEANLLRRFLRVDYIEYTYLDEAELATCQRLRKEHGLLGGDFVRFCRNDKTLAALARYEASKKEADAGQDNQNERVANQNLHPVAKDDADHSKALKKSVIDFIVSFFPAPVGKGLNLVDKLIQAFRHKA